MLIEINEWSTVILINREYNILITKLSLILVDRLDDSSGSAVDFHEAFMEVREIASFMEDGCSDVYRKHRRRPRMTEDYHSKI
jgi:hypothetical protein